MAFSFKQRADKGFDFFNDNQKVSVDDYVKATGANKANLTTMMAQRGDAVSQQAINKSRLPSQFSASQQPGFKAPVSAMFNVPKPSFVQAQQSLPKPSTVQTTTPLDLFKQGADLAVKAGQGIVNAGINTVGLLDPTINSQQRNERFQQSIPGAVYRPIEIAGNALGAGIASNVLQAKGFDTTTIANKFRNSDGVECNTYENVKDYFNGGPTEIGSISSMAVDAAGYIYICGNDVYGQGQIMKLDREGNIEWNYQVGSGSGYLERAIAIR
jgi:hypothetical protein